MNESRISVSFWFDLIRFLSAVTFSSALVLVEPKAKAASPAAFTKTSINLPGVRNGHLIWADYDNDGDWDLHVNGWNDTAIVTSTFRNDLGTFIPAGLGLPAAYSSYSLAWGDYDNDGDLDVVIKGSPSGASQSTRIWQNDQGVFTDLGVVLPGTNDGSVRWGDYDNDGDLDILLCGYIAESGNTGAFTQIWRNDSGRFEPIGSEIPGASQLGEWSDQDRDGDLDLLLSGDPQGVPAFWIMRNDGGTFVEVASELPEGVDHYFTSVDFDGDGDLDWVTFGSQTQLWRNDAGFITELAVALPASSPRAASWGDYDNDGDLDLALASGAGQIWRNDGNTFVQVHNGFSEVTSGTCVWGDYDNDGDLDLVMAIRNDTMKPSDRIQIWRNDGASHNTPPTAPVDLRAQVTGTVCRLSWSPALDAQSPPSALRYNLRVGTSPGLENVKAASSDASGFHRLADSSAGQQRTNAWLDLPAGTYYWSVQALDTANAGGPFSVEQSFAVVVAAPVVVIETPADLKPAEATLRASVITRGFTTTAWLEWGTTMTYGGSSPHTVLSPTDSGLLTHHLDHLIPETQYYCRAVAVSAGGVVISPDLTFVTPRFVRVQTAFSALAGSAAAWGDFDNDGDLDLLLAGGSRSSVWRNNADHTFSEAISALPTYTPGFAIWCDFDNDGDLDLTLQARFRGLTAIFRNELGNLVDIGAMLPTAVDSPMAWGDYDNDGWVDLAILNPTMPRLWHNLKGITLAGMNTPLPKGGLGSMSSADFDNDGDLDLMVNSLGSPGIPELEVNNGDGTFHPTVPGLPVSNEEWVRWGDYDNDGHPDIALRGIVFDPEPITQIWRNQGDGTFANIHATLPALFGAAMAWGDYDNDGDLDLALLGSATDRTYAQVRRNDGNGIFTDIQTGLTPNSLGTVAWADYDNDGDLDLMVVGPNSQLWRNEGTTRNTLPSVPASLSAVLAGGRVTFHWEPATDLQTPSAALTHNLRVGTAPGMGNVVSPQADLASGYRLLPAFGNVWHSRMSYLFLRNLAPGTYYWSVQVVDSAFAGGPWAPEASFQVADTDLDGMPDWWEVEHGLAVNSPADRIADLDGDGCSNIDECAADTNPADSASAVHIKQISEIGDDLVLAFDSAIGKVYQLERSLSSPSGPWTPMVQNLVGIGSESAVTATAISEEVRQFFRIVVQP